MRVREGGRESERRKGDNLINGIGCSLTVRDAINSITSADLTQPLIGSNTRPSNGLQFYCRV